MKYTVFGMFCKRVGLDRMGVSKVCLVMPSSCATSELDYQANRPDNLTSVNFQ